jgi:hypothetical protein
MDSEVITFPDPGIWSSAVGEVPITSVKGIFSGFDSAGAGSVDELSCAVFVEDLFCASFSVEGFWGDTSSVVPVP